MESRSRVERAARKEKGGLMKKVKPRVLLGGQRVWS
jgi:hypothetical protein